MYFDPVSSWLVVLIINGVELAEEKIGGRIAQSRSKREFIEERNKWLNAEIRKVKADHGLNSPEDSFKHIKWAIKYTNLSPGEITINLPNQTYIINLLEECSKKYSKYSYEEAKAKAEWYKNAASEATQRREQYIKQLKEKKEVTTVLDEDEKANAVALLITAAFVAFILVIACIIP